MALVLEELKINEQDGVLSELRIKARRSGASAWLLSLMGVGPGLSIHLDAQALSIEGARAVGAPIRVQPLKSSNSYAVGLARASRATAVLALLLSFLAIGILGGLLRHVDNSMALSFGTALSSPLSHLASGGEGILWVLLAAAVWIGAWVLFYNALAKKGFCLELVGDSGRRCGFYLSEGLDSGGVLNEALVTKTRAFLASKVGR